MYRKIGVKGTFLGEDTLICGRFLRMVSCLSHVKDYVMKRHTFTGILRTCIVPLAFVHYYFNCVVVFALPVFF